MKKLLLFIGLIVFLVPTFVIAGVCDKTKDISFNDWSWATDNSGIDIDLYNHTNFGITKIAIKLSSPGKSDKIFTKNLYIGSKSSAKVSVNVANISAIKDYRNASLKGTYIYKDMDCLAQQKKNKGGDLLLKVFDDKEKINQEILDNCLLSNVKPGMTKLAVSVVNRSCKSKAKNPSFLDKLRYSWFK